MSRAEADTSDRPVVMQPVPVTMPLVVTTRVRPHHDRVDTTVAGGFAGVHTVTNQRQHRLKILDRQRTCRITRRIAVPAMMIPTTIRMFRVVSTAAHGKSSGGGWRRV